MSHPQVLRSRRPWRIAAGILAVSLALSACSTRSMFQESLETAIPTAFENADIGITSSEADSSSSGFAVYVDVLAEFDDTDVTAEEFRTMLQLIVENAHVSNFHGISVFASGPNNATISLGARGTELGFPDQDATGGFSADWDDVVAFLKE